MKEGFGDLVATDWTSLCTGVLCCAELRQVVEATIVQRDIIGSWRWFGSVGEGSGCLHGGGVAIAPDLERKEFGERFQVPTWELPPADTIFGEKSSSLELATTAAHQRLHHRLQARGSSSSRRAVSSWFFLFRRLHRRHMVLLRGGGEGCGEDEGHVCFDLVRGIQTGFGIPLKSEFCSRI